MADLYVARGASDTATYSDMMNRSTPGSPKQAYALHQAGDRILVINDGVPITRFADMPYNLLLAGLGDTARTVLAAADQGQFGKPIFKVPDGSNPVVWLTNPYLQFENLDITHGDQATRTSTGEAVVTTDSTISTHHCNFLGCRIGGTRNIAVQFKYGPTPRDATHHGTPDGAGLDDHDHKLLGCDIHDANVHTIVCHGSNLEIGPWVDGLGNTVRSTIHNWGNSTVVTGQQKHAIYDHAPGLKVHGTDLHNDEALTPWQGSISQRASGMEVFDCTFHDMIPLSTFWYDSVRGVTSVHDCKGWNCYDYVWFFDAGSDTAPPYTWVAGSNAVDRFLFYKNTFHIVSAAGSSAEASAFIAPSAAAAAYLGGLEVTANRFNGNARRGIDFGTRAQRFSANSGLTGTYRGKRNSWKRDAGGILFRDAGVEYTLAQWQAR